MNVILKCKGWKSQGGVYALGQGIIDGKYYSTLDLVSYLASVQTTVEFQEKLVAINGNFAIIIDRPNFHAAACDYTRFFPLFFARIHDEWKITDTAYELGKYASKLDHLAVDQYRCATNTFPGRTLIRNLWQLSGGCFVCFDHSILRQVPIQETASTQSEVLQLPYPEDYLQKLDEVLRNSFSRLLQSVGNRQLVVPLSGGYDSRLIVVFLKRFGYKNVVCYTIGKPDSPEWITAQQVTQKLGYTHYRIDNEELIRKENSLQSSLFIEYYRFIGSYSNFTWLSEFPVLLELSAKGMIDSDAIFLPGHIGDCLSGSQMQKPQVKEVDTPKHLAKTFIKDHLAYGYPKLHGIYDEVYAVFRRYQTKGIPAYLAYSDFSIKATIIPQVYNASRAYTFFGYEARFPLSDNELVNFFLSLPYEHLRGRSLYRKYVHQLFAQEGVDIRQVETSSFVYQMQRFKNRLKIAFPFLVRLKAKLYKDKLLKSLTGEELLSKGMLKELQQKDPHYLPISVNEIMKDWYLLKVKEDLRNL